jgi:hypothetical protein
LTRDPRAVAGNGAVMTSITRLDSRNQRKASYARVYNPGGRHGASPRGLATPNTVTESGQVIPDASWQGRTRRNFGCDVGVDGLAALLTWSDLKAEMREKMGLAPISPMDPVAICTVFDIDLIRLCDLGGDVSSFLGSQRSAFSAVTVPCGHRGPSFIMTLSICTCRGGTSATNARRR